MRDVVDARLRRIFASLDEASLGAPDEEAITEADAALGEPGARVDRAFGVYTRRGFLHALESYGLMAKLRKKLSSPVSLRFELQDPFRPRIILWSEVHDAPAIDLSLSLVQGHALGFSRELRGAQFVFLEDIVMQHPGAEFDWSRPPLPEQRYPGLSAANEVLALLLLLSRRVGAEGLGLIPSTFHAAALYSKLFRFVDGGAQGRFLALQSSTRFIPRWLTSWSVAVGGVKDGRGRTYAFRPCPMVCPLSERVNEWFERLGWKSGCERATRVRYRLDLKTAAARIPWDRFPQFPPPAPIARLLTDVLPEAAG